MPFKNKRGFLVLNSTTSELCHHEWVTGISLTSHFSSSWCENKYTYSSELLEEFKEII